jgi:adenine specific DNA methylase Mod
VVCGKQKKKLNVLVENNLKNKKNMKATLSYNLNDPDDRMAHLRAVKSLDMASALFEITRNLKKQVERKYEDDTTEYDSFDVIQDVFDRIYEILGDNNIDIDELIN